jgi:hypothetical protein
VIHAIIERWAKAFATRIERLFVYMTIPTYLLFNGLPPLLSRGLDAYVYVFLVAGEASHF